MMVILMVEHTIILFFQMIKNMKIFYVNLLTIKKSFLIKAFKFNITMFINKI
mgnify:CR=1 FL=1